MITIRHFELGDINFKTEEEFLSRVQQIFIENGDEENMDMPNDAEDAAKYIVDFCGNFEMIYYQPNLTEKEFIENDLYSFQIYLQKENAQKDFPNSEIIQYKENDIEDFSVIDFTESFNPKL